MFLRPSLHFAAAMLLLPGCSSTPDRTAMPMVSGGHIEVNIRNTRQAAATNAMIDFTAQLAAGLDSPLRLADLVRPFPAADSEVTIRFAVNADGHVMDAVVVKATTNLGAERMVQTTLKAVLKWRFDPPTAGGKPTGYCCVEVTFENIAAF
jgi:TonB family protein